MIFSVLVGPVIFLVPLLFEKAPEGAFKKWRYHTLISTMTWILAGYVFPLAFVPAGLSLIGYIVARPTFSGLTPGALQ